MTLKMLINVMILILFLFIFFLWVFWKTYNFFFFKREESSCFECGFDPQDSSRLGFSLHFFSILILFMIFDVEIILLLHLPLFKKNLVFSFLSYFIFLFILSLGILEEWRRGLMDWI